MNKHLQILLELAKLDKQVDDFSPKIALVRKELDSHIAQKAKILQNIENLQEQIDSLQFQINESERMVGESIARIEGITKKQQEIRSEKELRALNVEEDIAKENLSVANEEIHSHQLKLRAKQEDMQELKTQTDALEVQIKELESSVQSEVDAILKEQEKLFEKRRDIVGKADSKSISFYEKIRRWAKNTSVVPVFKQACGGCFIRINDKTYAEVLSNAEIVTCPHCGRILYPSDKQTYKECIEL
ncbi:zinc ribbon domain-containing protein [Helicobacter himalayensis]|uniref:zinc ribbon domain-containing protein n=1 Tax=Helicobacter himalayensis TaxID=1591088 RepID=UPI000836EB1E|nr:C4-type zinc ribbon domain-containing protein [Helicobacter himalayensis]